ncbi:MAG: aminoacyl-tRNA hydrolase [Bacteroidales bacterium]|nr:aminoacyl-tRNA hydrolase [Bacteroidales bacterium]
MKYLITGLGNIGEEYKNTRHNIGFMILDAWARASNVVFTDRRYGEVCSFKYRGRTFILLKPSTFVNRSGNAVKYWLRKEKIADENLLVVLDDLSIPFGSMRLRSKGGDGGHNGLNHINMILGHGNYARLRFGIGNDFMTGGQVNYVLGELTEDEKNILNSRLSLAIDIIKSFGTIGIELTMTKYNKQAKRSGDEEGNGDRPEN